MIIDENILIEVEGLSKKFCKDLKTSLWYGLKDLVGSVNGKVDRKVLRKKEFWALKDINFQLRRGECLGLIGHNGAGKSTLLKLLNGLINPDEGKIVVKGSVGAIIELGAGFNPILTGRENIFNNGAVLGFSKFEIKEKLQEIIDFSELQEFIDMPLQHYSSGMKVRLGFAIAAQMEPDILIIDEVLAVGDLGFILKCLKTIDAILPKTAVIFVSHNMPMVSRISTHILLLEKGITKYQGINVSKGINYYYNSFLNRLSRKIVYTDNKIKLIDASVVGLKKIDNVYKINWGNSIDLIFKIKTSQIIKLPYISLAIYDKEERGIAEVYPEGQNIQHVIKDETITYVVSLNNINLSKGIYSITFTASQSFSTNVYLKVHKVLTLQVEHDVHIWTPILLDGIIREIKY